MSHKVSIHCDPLMVVCPQRCYRIKPQQSNKMKLNPKPEGPAHNAALINPTKHQKGPDQKKDHAPCTMHPREEEEEEEEGGVRFIDTTCK